MEEIASVLTARGAKYELTKQMRDKLVLLGNGDILVNENYIFDPDVLSKIAFFKNIMIDGKAFTNKDKIKYVSADEIHTYYDDNSRVRILQDANQIQKKVIDLIAVAFEKKVTDIHIELRAPSTLIYFRILGSLNIYQHLTFDDGVAMCTTLYNSMTLSSATSYNPREQQDANMGTEFLPSGLAGIRVATGPMQGGNSFMVLRLLPLGNDNTSLAKLGYSKSQQKALEYCISSHAGGITLICGPTGSGKSTSLQLMAKETLEKAKGEINFLTIEDPVEYPIEVNKTVIEIVKNLETGIDEKIETKIKYAARQIAIPSVQDAELKKELYRKTVVASMRQDPDVIMIGEIRDESTASAAITASNTGHPVLSTVHARNAQMIIDRLITIGADKNLLLSPEMLTGLFAQHLVPELCPHCKLKLTENKELISVDLLERLTTVFNKHGGLDGIYIKSNSSESCGYYDPQTTNACYYGYIGRFVIAEAILPDEQYLQYMRDGRMFDAYKYWIETLKGYTMMCHGLAKVKKGTLDPQALENKLKQISIQDNLDLAILDV